MINRYLDGLNNHELQCCLYNLINSLGYLNETIELLNEASIHLDDNSENDDILWLDNLISLRDELETYLIECNKIHDDRKNTENK